jgi:hypothetical protein
VIVIAAGEGVEDGTDLGERFPRTGVGKFEGFGEELLAQLGLSRFGGHEPAAHDGLFLEFGRGAALGKGLEALERFGGVAEFEEKTGALKEAAFLEGVLRSAGFGGHDLFKVGECLARLAGQLEATGVVEKRLVFGDGIGEFIFRDLEVGEGIPVILRIEAQHGEPIGGGADEGAFLVLLDEVIESRHRILGLIDLEVTFAEAEPGDLEAGAVGLLADEDLILLRGEGELLFAEEQVGVGEDILGRRGRRGRARHGGLGNRRSAA